MIENSIPVRNISDKSVYLKITRSYPGMTRKFHEILEFPKKGEEEYIDFATITKIEITDKKTEEKGE